MDARPEKFLRAPEFSKRALEELPEMPKVFRDAVGKISFEVCPDKFIRVKLGRVSWEVEGMNPAETSKELFDGPCPVERASIPEKND